jgi:uncharacterized protein YndB with AHSA1/START domain
MYTFTIVTDIDARPARVWRALCDPAQVVRWDTGVVAPIDAPDDYPQPGQHVRWRYAAGPFRTLHDRPQEVVAERTLRSLISIGPLRFDETYTLEPRENATRLSTAMRVFVPLLLGGPLSERLYGGPESRRTVAASMAALKRYCEAPPL